MNTKIYINIFLIFLMSSIIETTEMPPVDLNSTIIDDTSKLSQVKEMCNDKNGCQSSVKSFQEEKLIDSSNSEPVEGVQDFNKKETPGENNGLVGTSKTRYDISPDKNILTFNVKENVSEKNSEEHKDFEKIPHFGLDIFVKNIPSKDSFGGASDPYLKLFTKNPKTKNWEFLLQTENFSNKYQANWTIYFDLDINKQETVIIELWDSDKTSDEYLGSHQIDLEKFVNPFPFFTPLEPDIIEDCHFSEFKKKF